MSGIAKLKPGPRNAMPAMTDQKTIGLFGGSFNPPHLAHVFIIGWALSVGDVDEVWVIPSGGHPFGKSLIPLDHRLEMCRLAFEPYADKVSVLDVERAERRHYSIETVKKLSSEHPDQRWRWIIGSDALAQSDDWRDFDELRRLAPPLVIGRAEHPAGKDALKKLAEPGSAHSPHVELPDISSTGVRELLAREPDPNSKVEKLVPRNVLEYIRRSRLYRSDR